MAGAGGSNRAVRCAAAVAFIVVVVVVGSADGRAAAGADTYYMAAAAGTTTGQLPEQHGGLHDGVRGGGGELLQRVRREARGGAPTCAADCVHGDISCLAGCGAPPARRVTHPTQKPPSPIHAPAAHRRLRDEME